MNQLEKSVELYRLMAERCESNGFSPNQARVYAEMVPFISTCSSVEEATEAIKKSEYYLAPTEALVRDKIEAKIKAAREKEMPDVAEVYENKLKAIDADQGEMYTSGFEQTALNIRSEYILTMQAFGEIYRAYICYKIEGKETYINEINYNLDQLKRPSPDFAVLSDIDTFRELLTCTDTGYKEFVADMKMFIAGDSSGIVYEYNGEDMEQSWNAIKASKSEIQQAGRNFKPFSADPEVVVTGTKEGYR